MISSETIRLSNELLSSLFPINRSITGEGIRKTLEKLSEIVPLDIRDIPSGTRCFDWIIPPEWCVREAWIKDPSGEKIVDFKNNNLHLVSYSCPFHKKVRFSELKDHLHVLPDKPDAISYRTTYYHHEWGFCISYNQFQKLDTEVEYEVYIDSEFNPNGSLTYAQAYKNGTSGKEYIISTYCCHPSLANDNLSGLVLATLLFKKICKIETRHSYRLLIAPETIGVIAFLSQNMEAAKRIAGGYVITTVAGPGPCGYKSSFLENHEVDLAAYEALRDLSYIQYPFEPIGSDERQFSSPGFRIPVGTICKDKYYEYHEYHTSLDNLDFISADHLVHMLQIYYNAIVALEYNIIYQRTEPHCEYQLGRYNLYQTTGGSQLHPQRNGGETHAENKRYSPKEKKTLEIKAMNWIMHACDGKTPLLSISGRSGISIFLLYDVCQKLVDAKLLEQVQG